ncbi:hypothetical protein DV515_00018827 [Chloebia gouldiae]|uniref:Uncharacterized protein n=1 Tax=Chloebia gouldiae TaxID=44316 RepID=A0A3L8Q789_CHLGU|nr:hypothetical protein DV515_00018827 [Chloebia gouldiae]
MAADPRPPRVLRGLLGPGCGGTGARSAVRRSGSGLLPAGRGPQLDGDRDLLSSVKATGRAFKPKKIPTAHGVNNLRRNRSIVMKNLDLCGKGSDNT